MNSQYVTLFRKELGQNKFIFLFPIIMATIVFILKKVVIQLLAVTWAKNLAIAIPIALAFSYALQAFDLEENSQTRDFLLTKPLTIPQIVLSKFWSGFIALITFTILWIAVLGPDLVQWPDLFSFNGSWFLTYLLLVVVLYSLSFTVGAWVEGPKKILVAIFISSLGIAWFFYGWMEIFSLLYLAPVNDSLPVTITLLIVTLFLLTLFLKLSLFITSSKLLSYSLTESFLGLKFYLLFLFFPFIFNAVNLFTNPEIRPFNSLFACLNGSEEPFQAVDIVKQPDGNLYALTDTRGRLGIAKCGQVPTVIYCGEKSAGNILGKPAWSPDGSKIAFTENGTIKVLSLSQTKPKRLTDGDTAFWALDSKILLIAIKENSSSQLTTGNPTPFSNYRLAYIDTVSKKQYPLEGNLTFPGSSMFWHSDRNIILAITHSREIAMMNLNDGAVEMIKMPLPTKPGPVFLTKIAPAGIDSYRIAVFSDFKKLSFSENRFCYNLQLYDFLFTSKKVTFKADMKNLRFQDILINPGDKQIWGSNFLGVYRKIKLP